MIAFKPRSDAPPSSHYDTDTKTPQERAEKIVNGRYLADAFQTGDVSIPTPFGGTRSSEKYPRNYGPPNYYMNPPSNVVNNVGDNIQIDPDLMRYFVMNPDTGAAGAGWTMNHLLRAVNQEGVTQGLPFCSMAGKGKCTSYQAGQQTNNGFPLKFKAPEDYAGHFLCLWYEPGTKESQWPYEGFYATPFGPSYVGERTGLTFKSNSGINGWMTRAGSKNGSDFWSFPFPLDRYSHPSQILNFEEWAKRSQAYPTNPWEVTPDGAGPRYSINYFGRKLYHKYSQPNGLTQYSPFCHWNAQTAFTDYAYMFPQHGEDDEEMQMVPSWCISQSLEMLLKSYFKEPAVANTPIDTDMDLWHSYNARLAQRLILMACDSIPSDANRYYQLAVMDQTANPPVGYRKDTMPPPLTLTLEPDRIIAPCKVAPALTGCIYSSPLDLTRDDTSNVVTYVIGDPIFQTKVNSEQPMQIMKCLNPRPGLNSQFFSQNIMILYDFMKSKIYEVTNKSVGRATMGWPVSQIEHSMHPVGIVNTANAMASSNIQEFQNIKLYGQNGHIDWSTNGIWCATLFDGRFDVGKTTTSSVTTALSNSTIDYLNPPDPVVDEDEEGPPSPSMLQPNYAGIYNVTEDQEIARRDGNFWDIFGPTPTLTTSRVLNPGTNNPGDENMVLPPGTVGAGVTNTDITSGTPNPPGEDKRLWTYDPELYEKFKGKVIKCPIPINMGLGRNYKFPFFSAIVKKETYSRSEWMDLYKFLAFIHKDRPDTDPHKRYFNNNIHWDEVDKLGPRELYEYDDAVYGFNPDLVPPEPDTATAMEEGEGEGTSIESVTPDPLAGAGTTPAQAVPLPRDQRPAQTFRMAPATVLGAGGGARPGNPSVFQPPNPFASANFSVSDLQGGPNGENRWTAPSLARMRNNPPPGRPSTGPVPGGATGSTPSTPGTSSGGASWDGFGAGPGATGSGPTSRPASRQSSTSGRKRGPPPFKGVPPPKR